MSAQLAKPAPDEDDEEPDGYYIAYSGPYDVDQQTSSVAHQVQVSVIPSWVGTTQIRRVQFREPGMLELSASEPLPGRQRDLHDNDHLVTSAAPVGSDRPHPKARS